MAQYTIPAVFSEEDLRRCSTWLLVRVASRGCSPHLRGVARQIVEERYTEMMLQGVGSIEAH